MCEPVGAVGRTRRSHAVGREQRLPGGFRAKEVPQNKRWQVNAIGDKERGEFVAGEKALNHVVVPGQFGGNSISQMGAKPSSRRDGGIDLGIGGIGMAKRYRHSPRNDPMDKLRHAGKLRRKGQEPDVSARGLLQFVEIRKAWHSHKLRVVCPATAWLGRKPRPFDVVAAHRFADGGITFPEAFNVLQLGTKRRDRISDQCQEKPPGLVTGKRVHRMAQGCGGKVGLLEVHSAESVHLNIEQTGSEHGHF